MINDVPNWWQAWLVAAITINTSINIIVFFKHRFRGKYKKKK